MDARSKALRTADFQFQYRTKRSSGCLIIAASTPPRLVGRGSFVCDTEPGILDFTDDVRQGRLSVWHSTRMVAGKAKQTWRDGNSTTWRIRASQRRGPVDAEIYARIGAEARLGTNSCPHLKFHSSGRGIADSPTLLFYRSRRVQGCNLDRLMQEGQHDRPRSVAAIRREANVLQTSRSQAMWTTGCRRHPPYRLESALDPESNRTQCSCR